MSLTPQEQARRNYLRKTKPRVFETKWKDCKNE